MDKFEKIYKHIINETSYDYDDYKRKHYNGYNIFSEEFDDIDWYEPDTINYIRNKVEEGAKAGKKFIVISNDELKNHSLLLRGLDAHNIIRTRYFYETNCM